MEITNTVIREHQSNNGGTENIQNVHGVERDPRVRTFEIDVPGYLTRKKLFVRILGLLLLVLFLPLILLVMLTVRLTSPGPALYRQKRMGKGGRVFTMYKIRTMYQDAEKASGPVWCRPADPRITRLGRVLRFLHLDELPQLVNVARGEMDLIGPRPERPLFVEKLVEEVSGFATRLIVLPGVTGLAQINLPPDVTTDSVRQKLALDLEYIKTASWELDARILLCTALRMIGVRNGLAVRWLKLNRDVPRLKTSPRNASPPKSLLPANGCPENPRAMESLRVMISQEMRPGSNGSSQYEEESMLYDSPHLSATDPAKAGDNSALPKNPK